MMLSHGRSFGPSLLSTAGNRDHLAGLRSVAAAELPLGNVEYIDAGNVG